MPTALRLRRSSETVALVAHPSLAGAAGQVAAATRDASARAVHTLLGDASAGEVSDPAISAVAIGDGPRPRGISRALVLAPDPASARGLAAHARRIGAEPAAIELAIARPAETPHRSATGIEFSVRRRSPDGPPLLGATDAARLGRHLAGSKLGIALGAGGAWGFAHLGVLEVLDEAGYAVDTVAGTSVGALVGGLLAMGLAPGRIGDQMRRIFSPEAARELFRVSLAGISPGRARMVDLLRELCGERQLEALEIPLAVAVIDLDARRALALTHGAMWQALAAGTALPGLYPPWEREGRRLVDALALHPVPTGFLANDAADVTVAIDLLGGAAAPPDDDRSPRGAAARFMGALTEVLDVAALDASRRHAADADVVIRPALPPSDWRDVEAADHFVAAGREAARQQLPALRALVRPNQPQRGGAHV